jgi:hypothetical protein
MLTAGAMACAAGLSGCDQPPTVAKVGDSLQRAQVRVEADALADLADKSSKTDVMVPFYPYYARGANTGGPPASGAQAAAAAADDPTAAALKQAQSQALAQAYATADAIAQDQTRAGYEEAAGHLASRPAPAAPEPEPEPPAAQGGDQDR